MNEVDITSLLSAREVKLIMNTRSNDTLYEKVVRELKTRIMKEYYGKMKDVARVFTLLAD